MNRSSAFFASLLLLACCTKSRETTFAGAPVILISVDTLRSDRLPAYGYRGVATPAIDALRADSVLFERAYSHCPMTLPSHLSILTGLLPTQHGVRNNIGYRFERGKIRTLASVLRAKGYRTGAAVSSYVLRSDTGIDDGFDSYEDSIPVAAAGAVSEHQRSGDDTLRAADAWLSQPSSQPPFFFFHIYEPHAPYSPAPAFRGQYADAYDGEVATADAIVGRFLARLKALGLYDRTLIVFLSDHGEGLWQHGEDQHGILLYRESLQVPLLVKLPRGEQRGTSIARPVALRDVFPTVLALAGVEASDRSMFETPKSEKPIYAETLYPRIHLGWSELRSVIGARFHYIDGPRPELYDVAADPAEQRDVIAIERRSSAAMKSELQQYPSAVSAIGKVDPEEAAKLAALGYIGTPQNRSGPLPNPRDMIGQLTEIKAAFRLADEGRLDEAARSFRALLAKNPRLADVRSKLGEILVESGRANEAVTLDREAMSQNERFSPDLALALGFAYLKSGQPVPALEHAQLALELSPREAHELMARANAELRKFPEAEEHARAAIALGDRQPSSILLLAEVQRAEGNLQGALATIGEAERRANDVEVPHLYGIDYLRGDVLARLDRPDEAVAAYRREIANSPQHLQSYANLAVIELIEGKRGEAEKVLEEMARRNPHHGAFELAARTLEA
ncbi:MAG TPA: sulfatase-like hydrolase/transferase, partial [Thermoanaerobaculia bacterium]|nr:sulfatase-like hydrolase/transferase [Thermoanaerobaculia bacterium]